MAFCYTCISILLRVSNRSLFPDHRNLDVARVLHFIFDLLGDIEGEFIGFFVGNFFAFDNDPQFTTGLDGVGLHDTGIGECEVFEFLEALDIALDDLTACTRA